MSNKDLSKVPPGPLNTICDLGNEMRRVYRKCHKGEIDVSDMSRYVNALNIIIGATREADLEKRMDDLEKVISDIGHQQ